MFKIYSNRPEYLGTLVYAEDAAMLVAALGEGATVRSGLGRILWREGSEAESAGESYDSAAEIMRSRASVK